MLSGFSPGGFSVQLWSVVLDCRYIGLVTRPHIQWWDFLTEGMLECNIAHYRPVAILCMMFQIRYNPMHPHYFTLRVPYVPARVTRCSLVALGYTYAPPRCRTSHYRWTCIPLSVFMWNYILVTLYRRCVISGFKEQYKCFAIGMLIALFVFHWFIFLFVLYMGKCREAGVFGLIW